MPVGLVCTQSFYKMQKKNTSSLVRDDQHNTASFKIQFRMSGIYDTKTNLV